MEKGFENPSELEEQESWNRSTNNPNHIRKDAIYPNKARKETVDITLQKGYSPQQSWKRRSSDDPNHAGKDVNDTAKDAKESADVACQEVEPLQESWKRRRYDDPNHIGKDANDPGKAGRGASDIASQEGRQPQQSWKSRFDDTNQIGKHANDPIKAEKEMTYVSLEEDQPPHHIWEKKRFNDPYHRGKDATDPSIAGKGTADSSRTLEDWIISRAVNGNCFLSEEHSIIWPPVVIIENIMTGFNKTTNKWEGLGNNEIKSFLKSIKDLEYKKVIAIYNRKGHCGMAVVIFESNDLGYMNAETLSQCLERAGRGREDWHRVWPRHPLNNEHDIKHWNTKGLVADDGKRTIYGYLAIPADLNRIKPAVNKLSIESYVKKVLEPMKQRYKADEEVSKNLLVLEQEAKQKTQDLEFEKIEINQVAEELKKKDVEVQLYRKQEEEAAAIHKSRMEENKRKYEMDKQQKRLQYQQREAEIRSKLFANKQHFEKETEEHTKAAVELEKGIQKEKKEQELRLAEMRKNVAMRQMRLEKELAAKMEKKFSQLEERLNKKKLELQTKHHEEILQFKESSQKEREQLLQNKLTEQNQLEKQVEIAKGETERLAGATKAGKEEVAQCVNCNKKFGPQVSRALYEDCGHKDVCMNCAKKQWVKNKWECPICKIKQKKKFVVVPFKIFC